MIEKEREGLKEFIRHLRFCTEHWDAAKTIESIHIFARAADCIERLTAQRDTAVSELEHFRKGRSLWISVDEALPSEDEGVFVLTRSKNGRQNADKGYFTGGRWVHRGAAEVTHWMNIPKLTEV